VINISANLVFFMKYKILLLRSLIFINLLMTYS